MEEKTQIKLPIWAILLDVFGTLLLAAGLFGLFGGDELLSALPFDLREISIALIVVGALLMLPLIIVIVQRAVSTR